jgi:hypothetical protein
MLTRRGRGRGQTQSSRSPWRPASPRPHSLSPSIHSIHPFTTVWRTSSRMNERLRQGSCCRKSAKKTHIKSFHSSFPTSNRVSLPFASFFLIVTPLPYFLHLCLSFFLSPRNVFTVFHSCFFFRLFISRSYLTTHILSRYDVVHGRSIFSPHPLPSLAFVRLASSALLSIGFSNTNSTGYLGTYRFRNIIALGRHDPPALPVSPCMHLLTYFDLRGHLFSPYQMCMC